MLFKSNTQHHLGKNEFLDKIFKELPINSFIDKGRTGNGCTHSEIYNLLRCSIIGVPNYHITIDKAFPEDKPHEERFLAVNGDVTKDEVKEFLAKRFKASKVITTPAGLQKVIDGADELGMLEELKREWFFLYDESHSIISENYRDDFFHYYESFWLFEMKCMVSATPYFFSDPRMKKLHYHKININETLGIVNMVESKSVIATVKELIESAQTDDAKYFIFYNSVTEISKLLNGMNLTDCRIYCADQDRNMESLGEYKQYWRKQPKNNDFAKINFITTTSFEGWNMLIENCVMVVATDYWKPHTLVGIDKCVQAIGRARKTVKAFYHIYNHRNISRIKKPLAIRKEYQMKAENLVKQYRIEIAISKHNGYKLEKDLRIENYCDNPHTNPTVNTCKVDRWIYDEFKNEVYNHRRWIRMMWKQYHYDVEPMESTSKWDTTRDIQRRSSSEQLKLDYLELTGSQPTLFVLGKSKRETINSKNPLAVKASDLLTITEMEELKYNVKKVTAEIIKRDSEKAKIKLLKLVDLYFKTGSRYTKSAIVLKLSEFYKDLGYQDAKGKLKVALATQIAVFFDTKDCKIMNSKGKFENGYILLRSTFSLKAVA